MYVKRFAFLIAVLAICCVLYMTLGARGSWSFILPFRGTKLIAMLSIAVAVSCSTILFQTITNNGILTPSIMGFDALHVLIITLMVYFVGAQNMFAIGDQWMFVLNTSVLMAAAVVLFGTLLFERKSDLTRMVLTGVILGTLFRSLGSFAVRLIDPSEYAHIQMNSYARFNEFETDLLVISVGAILACAVAVWLLRHRLDILALGHERAIGLGENVKSLQFICLALIAILVSVSTSLAGPVVFLGLLVVSIARLITPAPYHSVLVFSAGLIAAIILIGGQTIIERLLGLAVPLSVVIDFVGGLVFLGLLLQRIKR